MNYKSRSGGCQCGARVVRYVDGNTSRGSGKDIRSDVSVRETGSGTGKSYAARFPCNGLIPSIVFFDFIFAQYRS